MDLVIQNEFLKQEKMYKYLKENSYFFKQFDRGNLTFKQFEQDMKVRYKERATDKISNVFDKIDLISSLLDVIK